MSSFVEQINWSLKSFSRSTECHLPTEKYLHLSYSTLVIQKDAGSYAKVGYSVSVYQNTANEIIPNTKLFLALMTMA